MRGLLIGVVASGSVGRVSGILSLPLLIVALTLPPGKARASEPEPALAAAPASECERRYLSEEYLAAARACELEMNLYLAGMARFAAGHDALALARWRSFREQGGGDPARLADVEQRIERVRGRTTEVRLEADAIGDPRTLELRREGEPLDALVVTWPAGESSVVVQLDQASWAAELRGAAYVTATETLAVKAGAPLQVRLATRLLTTPVRVRLEPERARRRGIELTWVGPRAGPPVERVEAAEVARDLPRGAWTIRATAKGYEPKEMQFVAQGLAMPPLTMQLVRDRRERARVGLGVGLGVAAATLLGVGSGIMAWGWSEMQPQLTPEVEGQTVGNLYDCIWDRSDPSTVSNHCGRADRATGKFTAGIGMVSATLGAAIPVALAARGLPREKIRIEAGVGGGLAAASLAWLLVEQYLCGMNFNYRQGLERRAIASGVFGASMMILSGAVIHLIVDRAVRGKDKTRGRPVGSRAVGMPRFFENRSVP